MTLIVVTAGIIAAAAVMLQHGAWMRQRNAILAAQAEKAAKIEAEIAAQKAAEATLSMPEWCRMKGITWVPAKAHLERRRG